MPRKSKSEPNEKVAEFISKTDDNSSSDDELELVLHKRDRAPVAEIPEKPKRAPRKNGRAGNSVPKPSAVVIPSVAAPDYSAEINAMKAELERIRLENSSMRKQNEDTHREVIAVRKNELDARREMMKLRFN